MREIKVKPPCFGNILFCKDKDKKCKVMKECIEYSINKIIWTNEGNRKYKRKKNKK